MEKEKYFIDLSKCTEEERKQIAKLILIKSGLSMSDYLDLLHGKIDEPNGSYLLEYAREQWHLSYDVLKHKTELLYPDFIKLFEVEGESENIYDVDFGGNVMARIKIVDNKIEVTDAMNGYGNDIPLSKIRITNPK